MRLLLRNERKKMTKKGKKKSSTSRYVLYGVGELILVVVGILIALSIDSWQEDRKEAKKEQQILQQLQHDYQSNLTQLQEKMQMRNEIIAAAEKILSYIDAPEDVSKDSLIHYFARVIPDPTFNPVSNDIIGTENLRIIKNDSLVRLLSNWTSEAYQVQELELTNQQIRNELAIPMTIRLGLARNIHHHVWKDGFVPTESLDKSLSVRRHIRPSKHPVDIAAVLNDKELEGYLASTITINQVANIQSMALAQRIGRILAIIGQEIAKDK